MSLYKIYSELISNRLRISFAKMTIFDICTDSIVENKKKAELLGILHDWEQILGKRIKAIEDQINQ